MDFEIFWNLYPRKVVKKPSKMVWDRLTEDQQQAAINAIPIHAAYWKSTSTSSEFIPHARAWLYQERWEDEIEMPQSKVIVPNWWTSESGIMAKAQEIGISVRPGESWFELKNRINEAIKQSA